MIRETAACLLVAVICSSTTAQPLAPPEEQTAPESKPSPLEVRTSDVRALFYKEPGGYDKLFDPAFLALVSEARLTAKFSDYFARAGRCTGVKLMQTQGPNSGQFEFGFQNGATVAASLTIKGDGPHLIAGLFLGPLTPASTSPSEVR